MVLVAGTVFGQYQTKQMDLRRDLPSFATKQNIDYSSLTKSAVWSNDFSNATEWTIGDDSPDGAEWAVCTYATAPAGWIPVYGMSGTFASESVDNGFALFNSDYQGGDGAPLQNAWIQFNTPIDLSSVASPRFVFTSYYKKWADLVYFEYSTDAGATWANKELFTEVTQGGATAVDQIAFVNVPEIGNEASVLIRFRFYGDWDYGIFIDDLFVVDAPAYDLQLLETATNFFQVYDYSGGNGYHYSSHHGYVPYAVLTDPDASILFNAVVKNNGTSNATPEVTVTIHDPNAIEVYNFVFTSDVELTPDQVDTLDIAWFVDEPFLITVADWAFGQYTIDFDLAIVGQEDGAPANNYYSTYFNASDNIYAKDGDNLNGVCGPGIWLDGGVDGDMFGVNYLLFETTTVDSVQAYVTSTSDAGTSFICHVMMYDEGSSDWVPVASSMLETVEEADLGTWYTFTFTDPAVLTSPDGETAFEFKIALEFYYNGADNDLWIGEDNTVPSSIYSTSWKFAGDDWGYISNYYDACPMIRACLPVVGVSANEEIASTLNIYPNPSTGIVNINNVAGARIEVLNMVGQTVATIENASEINSIDLSNEANGTYFVRVVKGNEVSTSKINLVK